MENPRLTLQAHFVDILRKAMEERKLRPDEVESKFGICGKEFAWVVFERQQLLDAVNQWRKQLGKEPIPIEELVRVERMAQGHVDYLKKYGLYCMELALDDRVVLP